MESRSGQPNTHGPESCFLADVGLASVCSRGVFSSLFWSRMMLRHPSAYHSTRREEGCSSTAFAASRCAAGSDWSNHADRCSDPAAQRDAAALP